MPYFTLRIRFKPSRLSLVRFGSLVLLACVFAMQTVAARDSIEISSSNDFEAPDIAHDIDQDIVKDKEGNVTIRAKVTDEFSINAVFVFFRDGENSKYRKRPMTPDSERGNNIYKSLIPSTALSGDRIEYYFEADDRVGNKKLKGLEFSPLRRDIGDLALGNGAPKEEPEEMKAEVVEEEKVEAVVAKKPEEPEEPAIKDDSRNWDHPLTSMDAPIIWVPGL